MNDLDQCIRCGCAADTNMRDLCRSCERKFWDNEPEAEIEEIDMTPVKPKQSIYSTETANRIFTKFPPEKAIAISGCLHMLTEAVRSFDLEVVVESAKILLELHERTKSPQTHTLDPDKSLA